MENTLNETLESKILEILEGKPRGMGLVAMMLRNEIEKETYTIEEIKSIHEALVSVMK
jgi:hypothetical protein